MAEEVRRDQETPVSERASNSVSDNPHEFAGLTRGGSGLPEPEERTPVQTTPVVNTQQPQTPENGAEEGTTPAKPPVQTGDAEMTEEEIEQNRLRRSKYLSDMDHLKLMQAWHLNRMPTELDEALKGGSVKEIKNGFQFNLDDGGKFYWTVDKKGKEFIGLRGKEPLTESLANAQAAAAVAHGWKTIDVFGTEDQKDKLWLAAQRNGLTVMNYEPKEGSDVYLKWQEEKNQLRATMAEADVQPDIKLEDKPEDNRAKSKHVPDQTGGGNAGATDAAAQESEKPEAGTQGEGPKAVTQETAGQEAAAQEDGPKDPKSETVQKLREAAGTVTDVKHREGIEKLATAVESGKIEVKDAFDKGGILEAAKDRESFNKTVGLLNQKHEGLDIPAIAKETSAPVVRVSAPTR